VPRYIHWDEVGESHFDNFTNHTGKISCGLFTITLSEDNVAIQETLPVEQGIGGTEYINYFVF
jgi:hypothetical protein